MCAAAPWTPTATWSASRTEVVQDAPGPNSFFSKTARLGFTGVAMMLAEDPDAGFTLNAIARILVRPDVKTYIPARLEQRRKAGQPYSRACADACRAFVQAPAETFQNITQTIHADLGLFLNPRVAAMTSANDFDLRELRRSLHAIYLVVHDEDLDALRPLTSLLFQQLVNVMTAVRPGRGKGCDLLSRHQVLGIFDEFVRLGKVPRLAHANSFVGGYDMRIIYIVQDRRQPEEHYGISGAKVLLNSCGVEMLFRTKDQDIAREVSERLGYDTVDGTSETKARAGGVLAPKSSETVSDAKRALLLPQEVTQLGEDEVIPVPRRHSRREGEADQVVGGPGLRGRAAPGAGGAGHRRAVRNGRGQRRGRGRPRDPVLVPAGDGRTRHAVAQRRRARRPPVSRDARAGEGRDRRLGRGPARACPRP